MRWDGGERLVRFGGGNIRGGRANRISIGIRMLGLVGGDEGMGGWMGLSCAYGH